MVVEEADFQEREEEEEDILCLPRLEIEYVYLSATCVV